MKVVIRIFLSLSLIGCQEGLKSNLSGQYIQVEAALNSPEIITLSDLANTVRYIPLETTDHSLIGDIADLRVSNDRIFISSIQNKTLLVFDKALGTFLNSVGQIGEGPTDYVDDGMGGIAYWVDEQTNEIWFATYTRSWVVYAADGTFLRHVELPEAVNSDMTFQCAVAFGIKHLLYQNTASRTKLPDGNKMVFCDRKNNSIRQFTRTFVSPPQEWDMIAGDYIYGAFVQFGGHVSLNRYDGGRCYVSTSGKPFIWNSNDNLRVKDDFNDTIYTVDNQGMTPYLTFIFGKWSWDYEKRFDESESRDRITIDYVVEGELSVYFHFHTHLYGKKKGERTAWCGVYNKQTGATKVMKGDLLVDDIGCGIPINIRRSNAQGAYYGLITAARVAEHFATHPPSGGSQKCSMLANITEEDNPVVVIVE